MNELELFAGAGGGILGSMLLGHRTVCAVEYDAYARSVLLARQADGTFPPFPIWDDVRTFSGVPWRGIVDVVSGGFPCQDISAAGAGAGINGSRSGLWNEMRRIIREVRPRFVFVENSPMLTSRGLGRVLGDLAEMGFDAEWCVLSAADCGAPHLRERIWILAHSNGMRELQPQRGEQEFWRWAGDRGEALANSDGIARIERRTRHATEEPGRRDADRGSICTHNMADAVREREQGIVAGLLSSQGWSEPGERSPRSCGYGFGRWPAEPGMGRVVDGMANRAHRIKALGNGQVPRVRAAAWRILSGESSSMNLNVESAGK